MSIKNYTAGAAIAKYRIVTFSADGTVIQGASEANSLIGVVDIPNDAVLGERVDVVRDGMTLVEFGGTVTRGDLLTTDSVGRAITSAPAAGVNQRTVGVAETSNVIGDIAYAFIGVGSVQG